MDTQYWINTITRRMWQVGYLSSRCAVGCHSDINQVSEVMKRDMTLLYASGMSVNDVGEAFKRMTM